MIKKSFFSVLFFLVLLSSGYAKSSVQEAAPANLDKIIAIVNSDVITQSELNKRMSMIGRMLSENKTEIKAPVLRKQALDGLIYTLLQLQLAQRNDIKISEPVVDNAISNIAKNNNLTVEQLKKSLQEKEGVNFKEYREQIRDQILVSRVQQQFLGRDIVVSDKEVNKVLRNPPKINKEATRYHVLDILIGVPDNASPSQIKGATNTAAQIIKESKQGVDLETVVQKYNVDGQQVGSNDLGWRKIEELPNLFAKEIAKIKVGQIAGPLKAPNGLHLIKLLELEGPPPQSAKFTKEQAQELVFHRELEKKLKPWLKELREGAYVKIIN
jgi:peptidyl-prolyl cis-trans isomerase SurA